ncbi:MAG: YCF48-related protein, partial [Acidobacteriota bacterium]|nr:YCF48-related protein [Acidobacteriota bacterium]
MVNGKRLTVNEEQKAGNKIFRFGSLFTIYHLPFTVFLLIICGLSFSAVAQKPTNYGWVWQNPYPQGNTLYSIHFAKDKINGFAVGADNTILHTEDGGFKWQKQRLPFTVTLSGVFVKDKKNAVVVGARGTIFTTDDGGDKWQRVPLPFKDHLYGITLTGENFQIGWAVGTYGR